MKNIETSVLENSKMQLAEIVTKNRLLDTHVSVLVKTLTPEEAIGVPGRRDFPIILGKERVVEADVPWGSEPMPLLILLENLWVI